MSHLIQTFIIVLLTVVIVFFNTYCVHCTLLSSVNLTSHVILQQYFVENLERISNCLRSQLISAKGRTETEILFCCFSGNTPYAV